METKIVVPEIGESIVDATLARWLKKPGDKVNAGEAVVELETDKVNLEVPAASSGILAKVERQEGEDVHVGDLLGTISDTAPEKMSPAGPETQEAPKQPKAETERSPDVSETHAEQTTTEKEKSPAVGIGGEKATPLARRVAEDQGIDVNVIQGSGSGGRVVRQDVENYLQTSAPQAEVKAATIPPKLQAEKVSRPDEERQRMSRRRRTIAQRLVEAQHSSAMLTTFNDVDITPIMEIRQQRKQAFKEKYGVSLGIVSFFVKASILALKDFPRLNSELEGDDVILKRYYDIGIAIGAEEGLVVPVLRTADRMTFVEIEKGIQSFVQKSQAGTLSLEDLRGGTFTITNGGVFGSLLSTPILNSPQVAILGLHRIEERPVAVNHQVVIRQMMYLAVSYDHRIVDGRESVQFLARIKDAVEHPEVMLLEG